MQSLQISYINLHLCETLTLGLWEEQKFKVSVKKVEEQIWIKARGSEGGWRNYKMKSFIICPPAYVNKMDERDGLEM